jgi:DNA-binding IscR family transcriptional regulator
MVLRRGFIYALETLRIIAERSAVGGYCTTAELAERLGVSQSYIEHIVCRLSPDYLTGRRGPGGGYQLRWEAKNVFVGLVADLFDDGKEDDPEFFADIEEWIFGSIPLLSLADLVRHIDLNPHEENCHV